jgi:hypothetical protein
MAANVSKFNADREIVDTFFLSQLEYMRTTICEKLAVVLKPTAGHPAPRSLVTLLAGWATATQVLPCKALGTQSITKHRADSSVFAYYFRVTTIFPGSALNASRHPPWKRLN